MAARKTVSTDELVADFDANYGPYRKSCKVCESPNLEIIDLLLIRGAGGPSVSRFLMEKFGEDRSQAALQRHKQQHVGSPKR